MTTFRWYLDLTVRDVPQLKPVREDQGWSQRTLAAKSGVAQNTISQLERGERKAMPSTVRKLADALGVDPPVLMAESRIDRPIAAGGSHAWSKLPPEELDLQFRRERREQESAVADRRRSLQREAPKGRETQPSQQPSIWELEEARQKIEQARNEWYESGRWAEYYVSGKAIQHEKEEQDALREHFRPSSDVPVSERVTFDLTTERTYLSNLVPALLSYHEDLIVARSRLVSGDPKETIEGARLILRRAKRIVEEYDSKLQSFQRIPEHYYKDHFAYARIQKVREALSEQRTEAAGAVQELRDFYSEALDLLEDQLIEMREEGDALEVFVRQAQK